MKNSYKIYTLMVVSFGINVALIAQPCDTSFRPNTEKKSFKFKNKFELVSTHPLKEGIYLRKIDSSKYEFYRFFKNGRVLASLQYCHKPDSIEFSEIKYGWKGYFTIKKNKIYTEFYSDRYSGYNIEECIITENIITKLNYKSRGFWVAKFKYPVIMKYEYIPVFVESKPDW